MVEKNAADCLGELEEGAERGNSSNSAGLERREGGCIRDRKEDGASVPRIGSAAEVVSVLFGQRHIDIY
jgi:hypothetical protein